MMRILWQAVLGGQYSFVKIWINLYWPIAPAAVELKVLRMLSEL